MVHAVNGWDELCNRCILMLENLCNLTVLTYGFINVLFFCILGPLSTLCFMGSTATAIFGKSDIVKRRITIALAISGMVCIFAIILPCLWSAITL